MRQPVEKEIDGHSITITMLQPDKALKILTRLVKVVGEPLAVFAEAGGLEAAVTGDLIKKAVQSLGEKLDEDDVVKTVMELMDCVIIGGKQGKAVFNVHFAGNLGHLFKVLAAVLEVQFGDFLGEIVALRRQSDAMKSRK